MGCLLWQAFVGSFVYFVSIYLLFVYIKLDDSL